MHARTIEGTVIDTASGELFGARVAFDSIIRSVEILPDAEGPYIAPGYIDAHIHIESTMLTPAAFAHLVAPRGTAAVVADPHEIANVYGMRGIDYMIENARGADIDIYLCAPSCVPATGFETSGATLGAAEVKELLSKREVVALGEMMNYPGVIAGDPGCMAKIQAAKDASKPVDGHCPGLSGKDLRTYIAAGISTDHESTGCEEAEEKAKAGMKVFVREGSSAKNLRELAGAKGMFAFCTDDRHVGELSDGGHMDSILSKAVELGMDPVKAIQMATINPAAHYGIGGGVIREGEPANIVELASLSDFLPARCYHRGMLSGIGGSAVLSAPEQAEPLPRMNARKIEASDIAAPEGLPAIGAVDASLITERIDDFDREDVQKLVVLNRYVPAPPAVAWIKGFSLEGCALAQTIAHDSHNIIATGSDDGLIAGAVNRLIDLNGGIVALSSDTSATVALEVAGLMSIRSPHDVARDVSCATGLLRSCGCRMKEPIATLSFMALPVIPHIKLTDKGLFDVDSFSFFGKI